MTARAGPGFAEPSGPDLRQMLKEVSAELRSLVLGAGNPDLHRIRITLGRLEEIAEKIPEGMYLP